MNTFKKILLFNYLLLLLISFIACKKEKERVMTVINDSISDVSYITAKAYATIIDPGEGIKQHGHCWSTNAESITINTENKTENGAAYTPGSYSSILTNLSPDESYYVRAYIKNGKTVTYGHDVIPFTTLSIGKPIVTTGTVTNITESSAKVSATLNSLGTGASSVIQHGHCCSSETITPVIEDNENKTSLGLRDSIGNFESTLVGLSPGTHYYVRAYATNAAETVYGDSISFTTRKHMQAEFDAEPRSGDYPLSIHFTDMSTGDIDSWYWNFGDDELSSSQNPLHTYNDPGSYTVTLTVSGETGSVSETKHDYIIVNDPSTAPIADFMANRTSILIGETVSFTDQSLNNPTSWSWDFGDGGASTYQNPSHTYNTQGTYSVTLNVSNSYGSDSETKTDYIIASASGAAPVANFTADKTSFTEGETVNFTDQSTNGPTSWSWDFGDGGTSSSENPSYQYNTEGIYSVTLTVTNSYGSDTETKSNYITVGEKCPSTVTDYDGNVYNTVQIGNQCWMTENLKTTKYNDGTDIPFISDGIEWGNLSSHAYCWYNNSAVNAQTYGVLYNWYTVNNGNLCPTGWHVPTDDEWYILTDYLGGESIAGGKLKESGTMHWESPNTGATNETGFTALPGGYRGTEGSFAFIGLNGHWWSATEDFDIFAWSRRIYHDSSIVDRNYSCNKRHGFSVRCLRD